MENCMTLTDRQREHRIEYLGRAMLRTDSRVIKRVLWEEMAKEINARSQEVVAQMERERGLMQ